MKRNFVSEVARAQEKHYLQCPGPNEIRVEFLKTLDDNNLTRLTQLLNHIYEEGNIPEESLESVFTPIPKNNNTRTSASCATL